MNSTYIFLAGFCFLPLCLPVGVAMIIGAMWLTTKEGKDDEN